MLGFRGDHSALISISPYLFVSKPDDGIDQIDSHFANFPFVPHLVSKD